MDAGTVLRMLARSDTRLSDGLRSALLLPEVRADEELRSWIEAEVAGYSGSDVPDYRCRDLTSVGDATNGAWSHRGALIPVDTLSSKLKAYATAQTYLVQSIGTLETLLDSDEPTFQIPWDSGAIGLLNWEIRRGETGVDSTYGFLSVRREVPRPVLQEILETVRHRALTEISNRVPPEQLAARIIEELPASPSNVAIQGSGNQVVVSSPGASATLSVAAGDWQRLSESLASLGIDTSEIEALRVVLDEANEPESGKVMQALEWSRRAATALGVNTAGSAAATLILQYLGHLQ